MQCNLESKWCYRELPIKQATKLFKNIQYLVLENLKDIIIKLAMFLVNGELVYDDDNIMSQ